MSNIIVNLITSIFTNPITVIFIVITIGYAVFKIMRKYVRIYA